MVLAFLVDQSCGAVSHEMGKRVSSLLPPFQNARMEDRGWQRRIALNKVGWVLQKGTKRDFRHEFSRKESFATETQRETKGRMGVTEENKGNEGGSHRWHR